MDLKKYDTLNSVQTPKWFPILDWDGIETDASVEIVGIGSKEYQKADAKLERAKNLAARRGKELPEEESDALYVELIMACLKNWKGIEENGKPLEFEEGNVEYVLNQYPYIRNFILKSILDVRAFVGN